MMSILRDPCVTLCCRMHFNATVKHKCIMQVDWNFEHATTSAILKIERCFVLKLLLLYLLITLRHCLLLGTQHDFLNLKVVWRNIDVETIIIKIIVIVDKMHRNISNFWAMLLPPFNFIKVQFISIPPLYGLNMTPFSL